MLFRSEPHNRAIIELGGSLSAIDFAGASRYFELMTRELAAPWGRDFDVLVTPTTAMLPPAAGSMLEAVHASPGDPNPDLLRMTAFAAHLNMTGQPGISLPTGWTEDGLPVGVQLVGAPFADATVLRLAGQLEEALPWADRRPQLAAAG